MPVLVIILNDYSNCLDSHPVEVFSMLSIFPMPEALPKNVEGLEAPVESLLPSLGTLHKILELFRMTIFRDGNLAWFTSIATITDCFVSGLQLKVKSVPVPVLFAVLGIPSTTEYCYVMHGWFFWTIDPDYFWFVKGKAKLIFLFQGKLFSSMAS